MIASSRKKTSFPRSKYSGFLLQAFDGSKTLTIMVQMDWRNGGSSIGFNKFFTNDGRQITRCRNRFSVEIKGFS